MEPFNATRLLLVHDWLTGMRGGEKCLEVLAAEFPQAPLCTLLHRRGSVVPELEQRPIITSWLNRLPKVDRYYRYLLPLMPGALERLHVPECDLIVSFSHCVAKSLPTPVGVPHVCYCFTPMRYAWHMRKAYFGQQQSLKERLRNKLLDWLCAWDKRTASRVTHFVAISKTVQERIRASYGRESDVIYPPVDTDYYQPASVPREDYYLVVSAFAPYKRLDLAVAACTELHKPLVVIGSGQDEAKLRQLAGPTVHLLGWQPNEMIRHHLQRCKALLFPGEEDFGIVPLEAQACGTPVIALGQGGATETVLPLHAHRQPTGLWVAEQSVEAFASAIEIFESNRAEFDPAIARQHALLFSTQRFRHELLSYLKQAVAQPERKREAA